MRTTRKHDFENIVAIKKKYNSHRLIGISNYMTILLYIYIYIYIFKKGLSQQS